MNVIFDNIKDYVKNLNLNTSYNIIDFNGHGDYKKCMYHTKIETITTNKTKLVEYKNHGRLFVYEHIKDDYGNLYDCEYIKDQDILVLSQEKYTLIFKHSTIADHQLNTITYYSTDIPNYDLDIKLGDKMICRRLKSHSYINNIDMIGRLNGKKETIKCHIYFTNMSYDTYKDFGNDYRHVNYNDLTKDFSNIEANGKELKEKIKYIQNNGIFQPIMFELYNGNLYPIYGRINYFAALYLKMPIIPTAIVSTIPKFTIGKFCEKTLSIHKLNLLLDPYIRIHEK